MSQETVSIRNLTIGYHQKNNVYIVSKQINESIRSGELTCLLGSNGVGKSTLLRTLSGFQPKLAGDILISGRDIVSFSDKELATVVSVVLTDRCDIYNMTVTEMIDMGRSPYTGFFGNLSDNDKNIVNQAINATGIAHLVNRMIHTLSDGERQKVMIAKALAQDTRIIYLDEPTAFLDFPSKVEMMQLLYRLSREMDKTIFLSTHDLELALQIADKIWIMEKGEGVLVGTPEDLALNGQLNRSFVSKGLLFDNTTGIFKVDNECYSQVKLIGNGIKCAMIRKALFRCGILAHDQINSDLYIDASDNQSSYLCVLHCADNEMKKIDSVEALLESVKYVSIPL